jgi:hypothetical protein
MNMKRLFNLVAFASTLLLFFSISGANPSSEPEREDISIHRYFSSIAYGNYLKAEGIAGSGLALAAEEIPVDIYGFKSKSARKAFILSLLLPGAGEFYAESKIKAGVFLGLEALFWTGYLSYHSKATDKEDEYLTYADVHWSQEAYKESMLTIYGVDIDTVPTGKRLVSEYDSVVVIEHLPGSKTQQYYEMIGKYDQFRYGWDDYERENFVTPHRDLYLDMRDESNKFFDRATYSLVAIIGNHILSGFDAVWSVKRYNRKIDRFSELNMKIRLVERDRELIPKLFLTYRF